MTRKGRHLKRRKGFAAQDAGPSKSTSTWWNWLAQHAWLLVLAGSAVVALLVVAAKLWGEFDSLTSALQAFAIVWMLVAFVFVVVVTESERKYARSGQTIQMACGAIAGCGIALVLGGPWFGAVLGLIVGGFLGLFGRYAADVLGRVL